MARLIDADALKEKKIPVCTYEKENGIQSFDIVFVRHIDEAPTVGAVEVVRCKDCTFCVFNSSNETFKCRSMNGMYRTVVPDDFCSYGERKDND